MTKEGAVKLLQSGKTLYSPTWYITMVDDKVYANCGYENCCEWEGSIDEFWKLFGYKDLIICN